MKVKFKNSSADGAPSEATAPPVASDPPPETPTSGAPKLKLKFGSQPSAPPPPSDTADAPKQKRKYTRKPKVDENGNPLPTGTSAKPGPKPGKKRSREENGDDPSSPPTKRKSKPSAKLVANLTRDDDDFDEDADLNAAPAVALPRPAPIRSQSLRISIKKDSQKGPGPQPPPRSATTMIRVKGARGKPPIRPPGVGYDSEAEEAEEDPAIESQFILRMMPGPECDRLRKAIEDKKIGTTLAKGGPGVHMRFFDREGRRAIVSVYNKLYAATMVDLPCVIESMKSWNKKDWVKSADVCQMLLVLGEVKNEEEAKKYPLPREVDPSSHQYAHGLTPPMHWVRKRRFRPRVSYRRIEEVEEMVETLLEEDRKAAAEGGKSEYQVVDAGQVESSESESESGEDEMEEAEAPEYVEGATPTVELDASAMDNAELEEALAAGLMADDDEVDVGGLFGGEESVMEVETPATSHDVAMQLLGEQAIPTTESPAAASTPGTESADDDGDDDDAESDQDEQAAENQAEQELLKEQIRELDNEIEKSWSQYHEYNNVLFKQRCKAKIDRLTEDRQLKQQKLAEYEG
ncbi:hypothetical protein CC78DRAFT_528321 [Lojkania enalia]|uniref:TAFII55 protein conserved region domain-containing protein n=1 Tax=Lojkania enalia TaxID=147567 RepID=A0A9P4NC72_9PLEO|nr:hypothetical protein CC78DRAFT_528321 [Didymosphaeria enalia]